MPIHFLSTALSSVLALETYPVVLAAVFAVVFLKQWSAGLDLLARLDRAASAPEEIVDDDKGGTLIKKRKFKTRDLHGNVILIVGGLTSQGLLVCSQLSSLGAQLILLTPTIRSSRVIQMIHLLRDGTSNPLIYAEECDIADMASVEAFAEMWNRGQGNSAEGGLGAGPAGDISASTGMGGIPGGGSGGEGAPSSSPRRIDSIIFMPLDSTHYSIGDKVRKTAQGVEYSHAEVLGRFHLINKLLPTLLLLPPHRDLRIVSLVSPWYAAGLSVIESEKPNFSSIPYNSRSPWTTEGAQAMLWLSLSLEMQRRIQLMTDAGTRPRTKLPGIDDQGKISTSKVTNVNLVNVCAGFERGRNVVDFLLPSAGDVDHEQEWEEGEDDEDLVDSKEKKPVTSAKASKKKAPSVTTTSKPTGSASKTKQALEEQLRPSIVSIVIVRLLQYSIVTAFWPLAWLLCKSPKRAAETVTWAAIVPMHDGSQSMDTAHAGLVAVPGELHREGRLLRPMIPKTLLPGEASLKIWKTEEERIKKLLASK